MAVTTNQFRQIVEGRSVAAMEDIAQRRAKVLAEHAKDGLLNSGATLKRVTREAFVVSEAYCAGVLSDLSKALLSGPTKRLQLESLAEGAVTQFEDSLWAQCRFEDLGPPQSALTALQKMFSSHREVIELSVLRGRAGLEASRPREGWRSWPQTRPAEWSLGLLVAGALIGVAIKALLQ